MSATPARYNRRMKGFKSWLLLSLVVFLTGSRGAIAEPPAKKFVVGLILPLTGELADYGEALRHGFDLAVSESPEPFSHIELRYQDSQYDQKAALSAFNALEHQSDVNLYHTWGVSPNETILALANQRGRPVLAETSMQSAAAKRPYVVRAARTSYDAAEKMVEAAAARSYRHIGLVVTQIPYYIDFVEALREFGPKKGVTFEIVSEPAASDQDFRSVIVKSKGKSFDAFGSLLLRSQILAFCDQAKTLRFTKPMFGAHIHNDHEALQHCLPLSDGAIFPGQVVSRDFRDRYFAKFGTEARLDSAAHSYETAMIIAELFGRSESYAFTPQIILERLATVRRENSSVGPYRYTESVRGGKSISFNETVLNFKGGKVVAGQ